MCRVPPRDTRVMPANAPADLLDPPAALRRLRADEAPYPGTLHAGDPQTVHVDADLVPAALWRCALDGHILAPWDLSRTTGRARRGDDPLPGALVGVERGGGRAGGIPAG